MKKAFYSVSILALILAACSKDSDHGDNAPQQQQQESCTGTTPSFSATVQPTIQGSCAISGCHAAGSTHGPGALTSYQQVYANRTTIRAAVSSGTMPKTGSLTSAQKSALLCWIDGGAPNN